MANSKEKIIKRAFKVALDTRKFEIGLYWKRAKYFFGIMCALGGASVVLTFIKPEDGARDGVYFLALFVIGCIGTITAVAWHLTNKGSKYWQENWEQYVDALGRDIIGPLFQYPITGRFRSKKLSRYSVSKINEKLSIYAIWMWGVMAVYNLLFCLLFLCCDCSCQISEQCFYLLFGVGILALTIFFVIELCHCESDSNDATEDMDEQIKRYFEQVHAISKKIQSNTNVTPTNKTII